MLQSKPFSIFSRVWLFIFTRMIGAGAVCGVVFGVFLVIETAITNGAGSSTNNSFSVALLLGIVIGCVFGGVAGAVAGASAGVLIGLLTITYLDPAQNLPQYRLVAHLSNFVVGAILLYAIFGSILLYQNNQIVISLAAVLPFILLAVGSYSVIQRMIRWYLAWQQLAPQHRY